MSSWNSWELKNKIIIGRELIPRRVGASRLTRRHFYLSDFFYDGSHLMVSYHYACSSAYGEGVGFRLTRIPSLQGFTRLVCNLFCMIYMHGREVAQSGEAFAVACTRLQLLGSDCPPCPTKPGSPPGSVKRDGLIWEGQNANCLQTRSVTSLLPRTGHRKATHGLKLPPRNPVKVGCVSHPKKG